MLYHEQQKYRVSVVLPVKDCGRELEPLVCFLRALAKIHPHLVLISEPADAHSESWIKCLR